MENKCIKISIVFVLLIVSSISLFGQSKIVVKKSHKEKERQQAEKLWEQIIEVKGGRKKLHSINNMLLIKGGLKHPAGIGVYLNVYPNKYWRWKTGPPAPEVTWTSMINLNYRVYQVATEKAILKDDRLTKKGHKSMLATTFAESCIHLLETKWLQPKPIRVERKQLGNENLDVVETRLYNAEIGLDERMDFAVDPETLFVRWIIDYYKGKALFYYYYDKYTTVDGIQMPIRRSRPRGIKHKKKRYFMPLKFEFNVEYDNEIFERSLTANSKMDDWKPKTKKRTQ